MSIDLGYIQGILAKNPRDVHALREFGRYHLSHGDYKSAKEKYRLVVLFSPRLLSEVILDYERLLEKEPNNIKARLSLADFYISLKDQKSAITELEEILEIKPECSEVYNVLGYIYLQREKIDEAIRLLEKAKIVGIKDISLTEMLALAYLEKEEIDKAISVYEELLESNPKNKKTLRILGELYSRVDKIDEASKKYISLFSEDPESGSEVSRRLKELSLKDRENVYIKKQLAEVYIKDLKPDLAIETFKEIEGIDKTKRDEIIGRFKKMLEIFPGRPKILIALGESLVGRGSYSEAAEEYRKLEALGGVYVDEALSGYKKIISKYPNQVLAHSFLGDVYLREGKIDEAIAEFQTTFELDKNASESVLRKLREIIRVNPESLLAHELLGEIYLKSGDARKAIEEGENCISLDKNHAPSYMLLASSYSRIGLHAKAVDAYRSALSLEPYNIQIHKNYIAAKHQEVDREIETVKKRIKEDQWRLSLHLDLAKLYVTKGDLDLAIEELQLALKDQSRAAFTHNLLGQCFKEDGRFDLAVVQFSEALRSLPPELSELSKVIGFNLGSVLEAQGLVEEAISQYQAVLQRDIGFGKLSQRTKNLSSSNPGSLRNKTLIGVITRLSSAKVVALWGRDSRAVEGGKGEELFNISFGQDHNRAGFEYFIKGMYKSAKEEFILATSLDPGLASALNNLGILLLKEGNLEDSESKISHAVDSDPTFALLHNNLGLIHYLNGNYKEAEIKFRRALSLDGSLSPIFINLGDVLYLQGNAKQAIAQWEKVKEFDVVSEFAMRRLLFRTL